ncbi:MAG: hypothetical protein ABTD50_00360 [Polyangiaceae bacterium]|jgi:hypothetical protein
MIDGVRCAVVAWIATAAACAPARVPDPRATARAYADAARRADADALYAMLSTPSRQARSLGELRAVVALERTELAQQAQEISAADARVQASARFRYADGEEATVDLYDGQYWVSSAGSLPGPGRTPEETLDSLRRVLARRSYAGLLLILSPTTRTAIERDLRSLVGGLSDPGALPCRITDDTATVSVPGGHKVTLRREGGLWKVDDFD